MNRLRPILRLFWPIFGVKVKKNHFFRNLPRFCHLVLILGCTDGLIFIDGLFDSFFKTWLCLRAGVILSPLVPILTAWHPLVCLRLLRIFSCSASVFIRVVLTSGENINLSSKDLFDTMTCYNKPTFPTIAWSLKGTSSKLIRLTSNKQFIYLNLKLKIVNVYDGFSYVC